MVVIKWVLFLFTDLFTQHPAVTCSRRKLKLSTLIFVIVQNKPIIDILFVVSVI